MDLLDRLLGHDAWTTRELLRRAAGLDDEELDRPFEFGHRSVRGTLLHLVRNMEVWSDLMAGVPVRANAAGGADGGDRSVPGMLARLERAAADLAAVARDVSRRGAWDETWLDVLDDPPAPKTYGGAIAHVLTHSMHHRAQVLAMLRRLGVADLPEGDVLSWEARAGDGGGA
jgi:uncharacterized damage-inducible protein DinB